MNVAAIAQWLTEKHRSPIDRRLGMVAIWAP